MEGEGRAVVQGVAFQHEPIQGDDPRVTGGVQASFTRRVVIRQERAADPSHNVGIVTG